MAFNFAQSWDEVDAEFGKHRGEAGWDQFILVVGMLRSETTWCFFPEADERGLNLYPEETYDFDLGWGRRLSIEFRTGESASRTNLIFLHISHIVWEEAVQTYETRSWE